MKKRWANSQLCDKKKTVVGVTGSPGSGKSEVSRMLEHRGAELIDVDEAGRWAVKENPQVQHELRLAFGDEFFPQDRLDRRRLGKLVFSDSTARDRLNRIVHPMMIQRVENLLQIAQQEQSDSLYVVIDAALLFEIQLDRLCDWVVTVTAPYDTRIKRACARDGLLPQEARNRMRSQFEEDEKIRLADYVVNNSDSIAQLKDRVDVLHLWILAKEHDSGRR